ncbi:MAG: hypothetical protein IJ733_15205 [Lachnospiraceae bacterium]|nr:hypothetical protein [Lachnospiraceae bacterium]
METREKEKKENTREITYKDIEKALKEEAGSLLAEDTIEEMLSGERKKFLGAGVLGVPSFRFVGNQVNRYTKGLLRHTQPLPFLYEFLGFMMELSMLVFGYMLVYGAVMTAVHAGYRFFSECEFLYACVTGICFLLFGRIRRAGLGSFLRKCGEGLATSGTRGIDADPGEKKDIGGLLSEDEKQRLRRKAGYLSVFPAVILLAVCILSCVFIWRSGLSGKIELDAVTVFFIYVASAVLSGLHNVLYSSFFVPYCTIGGMLLAGRPVGEVEAAVTRYKTLCYQRMLSLEGKTMEHFFSDEILAEKLMQKLRGRLAVYRGAALFGLLIPVVLAVVCVVQMVLLRFRVTVGLCVFTLCAFVGAALFLLAFLSANGVMKTLPKKKSDD